MGACLPRRGRRARHAKLLHRVFECSAEEIGNAPYLVYSDLISPWRPAPNIVAAITWGAWADVGERWHRIHGATPPTAFSSACWGDDYEVAYGRTRIDIVLANSAALEVVCGHRERFDLLKRQQIMPAMCW